MRDCSSECIWLFTNSFFSLSPAWKRTSCSCNIWLLWPHGASRASDPIICATLLLFSSIRPLHRSEYRWIITSSWIQNFLKVLSQPDSLHFFPVVGFLVLRFWIDDFDRKNHERLSGFKFAACHFFRIFVSDASLLYLIPFSRLCIKKSAGSELLIVSLRRFSPVSFCQSLNLHLGW